MTSKRIGPNPKRVSETALVKVTRRLGHGESPCVLCGRNGVSKSPPQLYVHICKGAAVVTTAAPDGCAGPDCLALHKVCGACYLEEILPDAYFFTTG